jgi:hypothetical protein
MKKMIALLAMAFFAACGGSEADPADPPVTISGAWRIDAGGCLGYMTLDHGVGPWGGSWVCTPGGDTDLSLTWAGYVASWGCEADGTATLDMMVFRVTGKCDGNRIAGTASSEWLGWIDGKPFVATLVPR